MRLREAMGELGGDETSHRVAEQDRTRNVHCVEIIQQAPWQVRGCRVAGWTLAAAMAWQIRDIGWVVRASSRAVGSRYRPEIPKPWIWTMGTVVSATADADRNEEKMRRPSTASSDRVNGDGMALPACRFCRRVRMATGLVPVSTPAVAGAAETAPPRPSPPAPGTCARTRPPAAASPRANDCQRASRSSRARWR